MEEKEVVYIIPANSKRSLLIFSLFRYVDLIIFGTGCLLTLILLLSIQVDNLFTAVIKLSPAAIGTFLILPVPNYHNVLVLIQEIIQFFSNRRVFIWKGWCFTSEYSEKQ